jgi:hypothetical protein
MNRARKHRSLSSTASGGAIICVGLLALSVGPALADVPIRVVDTAVKIGSETGVAFDADDHIVVAYWHGTDGIRLARVRCGAPDVTLLYSGAGQWVSLALGSDGVPAVAHFGHASRPLPGDMVCYSLDGGDGIGPQTAGIAGSEDGLYPVLALDSVDRPYVAFEDWSGLPLAEWARFDIPSGQWVVETVPGPPMVAASARDLATAVDGQDQLVVAYFGDHESYESVTVATRAEGGWSVRSYDVSDLGGLSAYSGIALAFDSVDAPHVAFVTPQDELVVLRFNILNVTSQVAVSGMPMRIGPHAMAIDAANRIRIALLNPFDGSVHLADNDLGWSTNLVDTGSVDAAPSLALDSQDRWVIAYADGAARVVKVAGPTVPVDSPGDFDCDGDVDLDDYEVFADCLAGPDVPTPPEGCSPEQFSQADLEADNDVDLADFADFQAVFTG